MTSKGQNTQGLHTRITFTKFLISMSDLKCSALRAQSHIEVPSRANFPKKKKGAKTKLYSNFNGPNLSLLVTVTSAEYT